MLSRLHAQLLAAASERALARARYSTAGGGWKFGESPTGSRGAFIAASRCERGWGLSATRGAVVCSPLLASPTAAERRLRERSFSSVRRRRPYDWLSSCGIVFSFFERGKLGRFLDLKDLQTLLSHPKEWEELDLDPIKKAKIREAMCIYPASVDARRAAMLEVEDWRSWFDYYLQMMYMGYFSPIATDGAPVTSSMDTLFYPSTLLHQEHFSRLKEAVVSGSRVVTLYGPNKSGKTTTLLELRDHLVENCSNLVPLYLDFSLLMDAKRESRAISNDTIFESLSRERESIYNLLSNFLERSLERSFGLRVTNYFAKDQAELSGLNPFERAQRIISTVLNSCESINKSLVLLVDHAYKQETASYLPYFKQLLGRFANLERGGIRSVVYTDYEPHSQQRSALGSEDRSDPSGAQEEAVSVEWRPILTEEKIKQVLLLLKESYPDNKTLRQCEQSAKEVYEMTGGIVWMVNGMLARRLNSDSEHYTWKDLALQISKCCSRLIRGNAFLPNMNEAECWNALKKCFLYPSKYRFLDHANREKMVRYLCNEQGLFHTDLSGSLVPNCYVATQAMFHQIAQQNPTLLAKTHSEYYQAAEWFIIKARDCSQSDMEYYWDEDRILWARSNRCNEVYALLPALRLSEKDAVFKYVTPWIERNATSNRFPERIKFFLANGKMDRQTILTSRGYIELDAL